jgi:hypothetical protein
MTGQLATAVELAVTRFGREVGPVSSGRNVRRRKGRQGDGIGRLR